MNEYFLENGHLTDDGLLALIREEAGETERLELAEHLSFCDDCLLRYMEKLQSAELMTPEPSMAEGILARVRRKARRLWANKYLPMTAAAALAITLWGLGVFNIELPRDDGKALDALNNTAASISQSTAQFTRDLSDRLNELFHKFTWEGVFQDEEK